MANGRGHLRHSSKRGLHGALVGSIVRLWLAFALAMTWSAGTRRVESDGSAAAEQLVEAEQTDEREAPERRTARRQRGVHLSAGALVRTMSWRGYVAPRGAIPPPPRWARPRAPPRHDDDAQT